MASVRVQRDLGRGWKSGAFALWRRRDCLPSLLVAILTHLENDSYGRWIGHLKFPVRVPQLLNLIRVGIAHNGFSLP